MRAQLFCDRVEVFGVGIAYARTCDHAYILIGNYAVGIRW